MPLAVLSPCLLKADPGLTFEEELLHYTNLAELLRKLFLYTNLKFQYYKKAPYDGYKMEIPNYSNNFMLNNLTAVNVYGTIQKMLLDDYIDLEGISPAIPPETFSLPTGEISKAFCSYLNYISEKDALLFIGKKNFNVPRPIEFCSEEPFKMNTSTYVSIELTDLLLPYLNDKYDQKAIFLRADFCSKYNDYVQDKIECEGLPQREKIALFKKIGAAVAKYNGYEKDRRLTALNSTPKKIRIVYKKNSGKIFYLSFDVESGGFEVFDHSFKHLGQYNFSCLQVKSASPLTHILKH